jgi:hypothetical protein
MINNLNMDDTDEVDDDARLSLLSPHAKAEVPKKQMESRQTDLTGTPAHTSNHVNSIQTKVSQPEIPLHSLFSLFSPDLPAKSYMLSTFAVVSWVSPSLIHRANAPFPPKRHLKIHDPTISARKAGITLAVFVDAKSFRPEVGTVALFKGVTMQRWEGEVILNKYAGSKGGSEKIEEKDWFVSDPDTLKSIGYDVQGMRAWWEERKRKNV